MKISTKGRYGLLIMLYLANNQEDRFISLKEIAEKENISIKYLEKIMLNFKNTDYFIRARGVDGGYRLKHSPNKYIIGDILKNAEGNINVVECLNNDTCPKKTKCKTYKIWNDLNKVINDYLYSKTLDDYIERN